MSAAAARSTRSLIDPSQLMRASALLLFFIVVLGWARPAHAQLALPIGPTLNGQIGFNSFTLQATGGTATPAAPYIYSITPGFTAPPGFRVQNGLPLPTNITVLSTGTGAFIGVATTSGTFTTSIRVTDGVGTVLDKPITLNIPRVLFSGLPPKATLNSPYSFSPVPFGGTTYTWSATGMPAGLGIGSTGTISGTPTVAGAFNSPSVTLTDTGSAGPLNTVTRGVPITVDPFAITTTGPIIATAGVFFSQTLLAPGCGAPCTWQTNSFGGLLLNSSGVLSGTPFAQTGTMTVTVNGVNGSVSKVLAVLITNPGAALSSGFGGFGDTTVANLTAAIVTPFGGTPPYTASLVGGSLPPGISLVPGSDSLCTNCAAGLPYLSGRPMVAGTYTFTLQFQDSAAHTFTPVAYNWRISPLTNQYFTLPLAGTTLSVGTPYSQALLVAGGSNSYKFTTPTTPLPSGLSIDLDTGIVSGTPTLGGGVNTQILITDATDPNVKFAAFININVSGPPTVVTLPATNVTNTSATLNGTYNPAGSLTNAHYEWGTTTAYGNTTGSFSANSFNNQPATGFVSGLSCVAGSIYHFRLVATNSVGTTAGGDQTFTCSPTVFTNNANNITAFAARLNGAVNPNGLATTGWFQWGTTTAYGNITPLLSVGSGTSITSIPGGDLIGLTCSTTYHFRAVASNANGTSVGSDVAFPPIRARPRTFTGVVAAIGRTNATLLGSANPNGQLTNAHFQWGATTGYGNVTSDQAMGSGFDLLPMATVPISGLACGSTYHVRTVATNSFGTSNSADRAFTTAPCVPTAITGTVYTLVGYPFTNLVYGHGVTGAGALVQLPGFPALTGGVGEQNGGAPEHLTYDPAKKRLYVVNSQSNTVSVFDADPRTGALTPTSFSPIVLPPGIFFTTVKVHPSGSPLVVGGFVGGFDNPVAGAGQIASYVITPTTATPAVGSPFATSTTLVFSTAFSRDGNYVYTGAGDGVPNNPSTGGFAVNPTNGVLTPLGGSPFALGGSFPIGYATDASGRLFSVNNEGNTVRAFTTAGGVPTAVSGNPFAAPGLNDPIAGIVHPAGFYMVADSADSGKVGVYRIAGSGAATTLTNVAGSPFATGRRATSSLASSKEGNHVIALNSDSRSLTVFSVNSSTGALTTVFTQPDDTLTDSGGPSSIAFAPSGVTPVGDYDGDGKADLSLFRPSTGTWYVLKSSSNFTTFIGQGWGLSTDTPIPGDFDGDGKADFGLFRPSTGTWWVLLSSSNFTTYLSQQWGLSTDVPMPGDYDGDGKTDFGLFRPSTGTWWILLSSSNYTTYLSQGWGLGTDTPLAADFDGDGKTDLGLFRPSTGTWWVLLSSTNFTTFRSQGWGLSTDVAVPADYDGDGKADFGLFRPSTATWWVLLSSTNYTTFLSQGWGLGTDTPVVSDYDGDGKADLGVFRPSTGTWYALLSSSNFTTYGSQAWGLSTDIPILHKP